MAFIRDRNAKTRGVGAVAALDMVSSAGRRQQRARVLQMARRDGRMARLAMGALDLGTRPTRVTSQGTGIKFDYGTSNQPTPPPTRGTTPGVVTSPTTGRLTPTRAAEKFPQAFSQSMETFPGPGNTQTPPPPLPPPVEVVDTKPPSSSSGGGGGGGGGGYGGGGNPGGGIVPPEITPEDMPDTVAPGTSGGLSNKTLAIGAAALLGAYFLLKKKA